MVVVADCDPQQQQQQQQQFSCSDLQFLLRAFLHVPHRLRHSSQILASSGRHAPRENMLCSFACFAAIGGWFQAYDNLQSLAVVLLYIQVTCSLIGSLGAGYTGILLANLAVALFALVAIESGSQKLGRIYAVLLGCVLLLDVVWLVLFSVEIRRFEPGLIYGRLSVFSLRILFWMQVGGFVVRFLSAFVWLQMYRLGMSSGQGVLYQPIDCERGVPSRQTSLSDEVLAGSIYNPAFYSTLFRCADEPVCSNEYTRVSSNSIEP